VHTENNSYSIHTPKSKNRTAHLTETLSYLHTFASVHSELHAFRSLCFSGILMVSVYNNMSNCECKSVFSSRIASLSELSPPLWLSSITLRYAMHGRTSLVRRSPRRRHLYLTIHNTHGTHIYIPTGFEHATPASQWSWTQALECVAPGVEPSHWLNVMHNCGSGGGGNGRA
jgi:hypothetical protein